MQRFELRDVGLGRGLIGEAPLIGEFALAETAQRSDLVRVVLRVIPERPEATATALDRDGMDAAPRVRGEQHGAVAEIDDFVRVTREGVEAARLAAPQRMLATCVRERDLAREVELAAHARIAFLVDG